MTAAALQTADWGDHSVWRWRELKCHWRLLGADQSGPPVLLLHGFGASSAHWRHLAPQMATAGFQVYALDLIGFGDSDQPGWRANHPLDNRLWARQVVAFIQQVIQRPAVLIGNSLGGLTALTAAVLDPTWVRAVVAAPLPDPALVQPLPQRRSPGQRHLQRRVVTWVLRLLPLELIVPLIARTPLLKGALQGAYRKSIRHDTELLRLIARPARRPTAARALRSMSIGMSLRPRGATAPALLQQLEGHAPLLLLWGRQDRFVPLSIGTSTAARHPWLRLEVLENCGHCPHDERPEEMLEILLPWLDRNLGISSPLGTGQRR